MPISPGAPAGTRFRRRTRPHDAYQSVPSPALGRAVSSRLLRVVLRVRGLEYLRSHLPLAAEERRLEDDVVRRDAPDVEEIRELDTELPRHQVVGGLVAGGLADIAVDVRHHEVDVLLRQRVERRRQEVVRALRRHEPDELVVAPDVPLLVRRAGVHVEQVGDLVALAVPLDPVRQRELGAVVRDEDEEQPGHHRRPRVPAELPDGPAPDRCERRRDVGRSLLVHEEREHEAVRHEHERRQRLASLRASHGVHFRERKPGVLGDEPPAVLPRAPDAALPVHRVFLDLAPAGFEPALARKVPVPRREESAVGVAVERLLADREQARVVDHRRVDGLPVLRQAVEQLVEPGQLRLRDVGSPPLSRRPDDGDDVLSRN